jgi:hypothetical protein
MGSIVGCGKLVKKKSTRNHKMFRSSCRKRLLVVLSAPTAANSGLEVSRYRKPSVVGEIIWFLLFSFSSKSVLEVIFRYVRPLVRELHPRHSGYTCWPHRYEE